MSRATQRGNSKLFELLQKIFSSADGTFIFRCAVRCSAVWAPARGRPTCSAPMTPWASSGLAYWETRSPNSPAPTTWCAPDSFRPNFDYEIASLPTLSDALTIPTRPQPLLAAPGSRRKMASEPSRDAGELGRPRWGHAHAGAPRASRRRRRRRRDGSRIPQRLPGDVRRRRRQGVLHQARDPRRVRPLLHAVHGAGQGLARGGTRALVQLRVHRATARDGRRETRNGQTGSRVQQRRRS